MFITLDKITLTLKETRKLRTFCRHNSRLITEHETNLKTNYVDN